MITFHTSLYDRRLIFIFQSTMKSSNNKSFQLKKNLIVAIKWFDLFFFNIKCEIALSKRREPLILDDNDYDVKKCMSKVGI
jgi:hypothetical protein